MYARFANTPLITDFIKFAAAQPDDRPIKSHNSWNECAVGDFMREVKGHEVPLARVDDGIGDNFEALWADQLMTDFVNQLELHPNLDVELSSVGSLVRTYGVLNHAIAAAVAIDDADDIKIAKDCLTT